MDYRKARQEVVEKNKGIRDKRMTLEEAVGMIKDKDHVAVGGLQYTRTPMGVLWEIIRQRKKEITFYKPLMSFEGDWLFVSGAMGKAVTSWFSGGVTWGVSKIMRTFAERDPGTFEEWSLLGLSLRFKAGAMGIPSIPTKTMLGSDLEKIRGLKRFSCPYSGEEMLLIPAVNPDVAIIHSQIADLYGNAQIFGPPCLDIEAAKAANRVILTTEQIVDNEHIRDAPNSTNIPFFCVDAVVELPFGCYPHECYGRYEPAYEKLGEYGQGLLQAKDKIGFVQEFLDKYFYQPADFEGVPGFIWCAELVGSDSKRKDLAAVSDYNPAELTVIMGSRALHDSQIVFAGAGLPLLSAIHAQKMHAPGLAILFEVGGVAPRITSLPRSTNEARSVRRSVATPATIDMMLYLQRGFVDVGFLGGAQIDRHGNINSSCIGTLEKPKVRLPGSGGANDIASLANRVFIISYHEERRFVEKVDFLTSPGFLEGGQAREETGLMGGGVEKVITNLGILEFDKKTRSMNLTAVHPGITEEEVREKTGFELPVAEDLKTTTPPSDEELQSLRALDPEKRYLKAGEF